MFLFDKSRPTLYRKWVSWERVELFGCYFWIDKRLCYLCPAWWKVIQVPKVHHRCPPDRSDPKWRYRVPFSDLVVEATFFHFVATNWISDPRNFGRFAIAKASLNAKRRCSAPDCSYCACNSSKPIWVNSNRWLRCPRHNPTMVCASSSRYQIGLEPAARSLPRQFARCISNCTVTRKSLKRRLNFEHEQNGKSKKSHWFGHYSPDLRLDLNKVCRAGVVILV